MEDTTLISFDDIVAGRSVGGVDDVVLRRNDGVPSYNLAVVVDDAVQGVTQVVRGDDLLDSTPRQIHLQDLLGLPRVEYGHVPLVVGTDGERLSKRHGSVSLTDVVADGASPAVVVRTLLASTGVELPDHGIGDASLQLIHALEGFELGSTPRSRIVFAPMQTSTAGFALLNEP